MASELTANIHARERKVSVAENAGPGESSTPDNGWNCQANDSELVTLTFTLCQLTWITQCFLYNNIEYKRSKTGRQLEFSLIFIKQWTVGLFSVRLDMVDETSYELSHILCIKRRRTYQGSLFSKSKQESVFLIKTNKLIKIHKRKKMCRSIY